MEGRGHRNWVRSKLTKKITCGHATLWKMEIFRRSFRHQKFSTGKFVGASSLGILTHSGHLFYILEPLWKTDLSWTPLSTTSETLSYSTDAYQIINWSWRFTQVVMHLCPDDQESYYPLVPTGTPGTAAQMNILKNSISLQKRAAWFWSFEFPLTAYRVIIKDCKL